MSAFQLEPNIIICVFSQKLAYWHTPTQHNLQTMVAPNIYNQQTMVVEH